MKAVFLYLAAIFFAVFLTAGDTLAGDVTRADAMEVPAVEPPGHPKGPLNGLYQQGAFSAVRDGIIPSVDSLKMLIVLVTFTDITFSGGRDSLYFANELKHLVEYYDGASLGSFGLSWEIAPGVTALSREEGWYGEDDKWEERVALLLMEVVAANDETIDFSQYQAFAVIHAGSGQETDFNGDSDRQLWSGFMDPEEMEQALADTTGTPGVATNDGGGAETFFIDNLMVLPETATQDGYTFGSLGIYAYQVGLRLGMVPLYDTTPPGFPDSQGIGTFGLMGYGIYNAAGFIPAFPCAFNRYLMGWARPVVVGEEATIRLKNINNGSGGDTVMARVDINPSEYYLIVNRLHDDNLNGRFDFTDLNGDGIPDNEDPLGGAEFDFFLTSTTDPVSVVNIDGVDVKLTDTGGGLMIWHIDERIIASRLESGSYPNDESAFKGVDLEEADEVQDLDRPGGAYSFGGNGDSFRGGWRTVFGPETIPSSAANNTTSSGILVEDISNKALVMSFNLRLSPVPGKVRAGLGGDISGLDPIPAVLGGGIGEELLLPVNSSDGAGRIYTTRDAGLSSWTGEAYLLAESDGTRWAGTPVLADIDGDGSPEIFLPSTGGEIHAFHADGSPFKIGFGGDPGILDPPGDIVTSGLSLETDGDGLKEVVFLASDGDSTTIYMIGHSEPLPGSFEAGAGVTGITPFSGRPVSHPAERTGLYTGGVLDGFSFVASIEEGKFTLLSAGFDLSDHTVEFHTGPAFEAPDGGGNSLLVPACGDIDRDGVDELVLTVGGVGLVYLADEIKGKVSIRDRNISPPALADLDGDGILETFFRDDETVYIFTGFGVSERGWPLEFPGPAEGLEDRGAGLAQPLAADIDGDGDIEIIFNGAGAIYAMERSGKITGGYPLDGEGDRAVTPALLEGEEGILLFAVGSWKRVDGTGQFGPTAISDSTSITRYSTGVSAGDDISWPFFRHDAGGSGRQAIPAAPGKPASFVDDRSFICYPNPVRGESFTVRIEFEGPGEVTVRILNLEGEEVTVLRERHPWTAGTVPFETTVPVGDMAGGVYFCHVDISGNGGKWSGARKIAVTR